MHFRVNGRPVEFHGDEQTPLLWVIRDHLKLTGTKFGCGRALCGACTVHVEGAAIRSCSYPVQLVAGKQVTTIEGLSPDRGHPVQQAWIQKGVPQCGYCQSGMIMAVVALLEEIPHPTDEEIDSRLTNLCRCATYHRIREAIHLAASSN